MRLVQMAVAAPILSLRFGSSINWKARQRLAVYPDLGIVYNRIRKNANTTTVLLLREMETGEVETTPNGPKNAPRIDTLSISQTIALRSYLFFVIVRNPYPRVLSAFLNQMRRTEYQQKYGRFPLTPGGFQTFVDWLADGGLEQNQHWGFQTEQMFLPTDKFSEVIRFETLKPDMEAMLTKKGLRVPEGRLDGLYPSDVNKKTSSDARLSEFYAPSTITKVLKLYEADFAALNYPRDFPA